mmetsp:Transcript_52916/g.133710  ORF Transcript_52916/g.133710 Transcript_52916/m.133710 type:complete len:209 (+) Transcript_52916:482-1108(+)
MKRLTSSLRPHRQRSRQSTGALCADSPLELSLLAECPCGLTSSKHLECPASNTTVRAPLAESPTPSALHFEPPSASRRASLCLSPSQCQEPVGTAPANHLCRHCGLVPGLVSASGLQAPLTQQRHQLLLQLPRWPQRHKQQRLNWEQQSGQHALSSKRCPRPVAPLTVGLEEAAWKRPHPEVFAASQWAWGKSGLPQPKERMWQMPRC